ncbi:MAG: hypothetical protein WA010_09195, partial [Sulfuricurvum sp.]
MHNLHFIKAGFTLKGTWPVFGGMTPFVILGLDQGIHLKRVIQESIAFCKIDRSNAIFGSEALASPSCFIRNCSACEAFGGAKAPLPMQYVTFVLSVIFDSQRSYTKDT